MKLTASQDRDAVGAWIEGQADRQEGKRILGDLPRLQRGEGYLWAPGHGILERVTFPLIRTFDSSRAPRRGERVATPHTLAKVDLTAIIAKLERQLADAKARIVQLERDNRDFADRLAQIAGLASGGGPTGPVPAEPMSEPLRSVVQPSPPPPARATWRTPRPKSDGGGELHPAARKMLTALAQHTPGRFTWGQVATLAGLKPRGGHFNAGRKELREAGYVAEASDLVSASPAGLKAAGEVPPQPSPPAERLALWCSRLPLPAPEMLRALAAHRTHFLDAEELAAMLGKKPTGGHWNSGIAVLRNNGLLEANGRRFPVSELLR